jgi:hypothetical protein
MYVHILWELLRYDALFAWRGMAAVRPQPLHIHGTSGRATEAAICQALRALAPFYWKPIRCLQRSIVTARVMRDRGIAAEVVIGYIPSPFASHAWVEVDGRIANDSAALKNRLLILERM